MTGGDERGPSLPVVRPPETMADPVREGPVAGVLLAAGTSSRFGETNKLLEPLDGEPLVRHAGRTLAAVGLSPLVAVLGHDSARVRDALDGLGFTFVENPAYETGQSTSVRAGIEALAGVAGAVVALGDMPFVSPASVTALVAAYRAGLGTALAAACDGRRGNPVLFDARYFDALTGVSGDVGGRKILLTGGDSVLVETGDRGVLRDVDTPADLASDR
jgi:molybdenum cofactor cytidylyltransferase